MGGGWTRGGRSGSACSTRSGIPPWSRRAALASLVPTLMPAHPDFNAATGSCEPDDLSCCIGYVAVDARHFDAPIWGRLGQVQNVQASSTACWEDPLTRRLCYLQELRFERLQMPPLPSPNGLLPSLNSTGNTDFIAALKRLEVIGRVPPIACCCSHPCGGCEFCGAHRSHLSSKSSAATRPTVELAGC